MRIDVEMGIENKIVLLFISFATIMGIISNLLEPPVAFLLAIFLFYISYRLVPIVFDLVEEPLDDGKTKILKVGFIPYWFLWLVFWILTYNIML